MIIQIATLLIGTLCLFLGYKLLMGGIYSDSAKAAIGDSTALLKRSAPGVIFALFGAAMIFMGLMHGGAFRHRDASSAMPQTQTEEEAPIGKQPASTQPAKRKHAREDGRRQRTLQQQAEQPVKSAPAESLRDDEVQPQPAAKAWKPGRA
jgi:hypothetical protein